MWQVKDLSWTDFSYVAERFLSIMKKLIDDNFVYWKCHALGFKIFPFFMINTVGHTCI